MREQPDLQNVNSIVEIVETMNDAITDVRAIPERRDQVDNLWFLLEGDGQIAQMVDPDATEALISATIAGLSSRSLAALVRDIGGWAAARTSTACSFELTGMGPIYQHLDSAIVSSQLWSLLLAFAFMFICNLLMLRSVSGALVGLVPIIFTLFVLFGVMGATGIPLDIATVLLGSISLGMGIDYSIHFLNRYRKAARLRALAGGCPGRDAGHHGQGHRHQRGHRVHRLRGARLRRAHPAAAVRPADPRHHGQLGARRPDAPAGRPVPGSLRRHAPCVRSCPGRRGGPAAETVSREGEDRGGSSMKTRIPAPATRRPAGSARRGPARTRADRLRRGGAFRHGDPAAGGQGHERTARPGLAGHAGARGQGREPQGAHPAHVPEGRRHPHGALPHPRGPEGHQRPVAAGWIDLPVPARLQEGEAHRLLGEELLVRRDRFHLRGHGSAELRRVVHRRAAQDRGRVLGPAAHPEARHLRRLGPPADVGPARQRGPDHRRVLRCQGHARSAG